MINKHLRIKGIDWHTKALKVFIHISSTRPTVQHIVHDFAELHLFILLSYENSNRATER